MKNYSNFVSEKTKPSSDVIPTIDASKIDLSHAAFGLSGESGEVLDLIKKHVFYNKPLNRDKLLEEMGDVIFYFQMMLNALDVSLDDVISGNVVKLSKRYEAGFTDAEAVARNDEELQGDE